jgi:hypothetical protein
MRSKTYGYEGHKSPLREKTISRIRPAQTIFTIASHG